MEKQIIMELIFIFVCLLIIVLPVILIQEWLQERKNIKNMLERVKKHVKRD